MLTKLTLIALAGGMGTLARYGLAGLAHRIIPGDFPWGTWSVNLIGSFLFGLVWALASERAALSPEARLLILTGFMGAFTTFSTFMFETGELMRSAQYMTAFLNLLGQNVLGLAAVFLGWMLARSI